MAAEGQVTVVVLAAQRDGELDPLAAAAGVTHKCLVPICGRPLLAHVLKALEGVSGIESVRISVEAGAEARLRPITGASPLPIQFSESADNLADSVYRAAQGAAGPIIVTTADNVLVRAAPIEAVARRLSEGDDVVIAVARKENIRAAHRTPSTISQSFATAAFRTATSRRVPARTARGRGVSRRRPFFQEPAADRQSVRSHESDQVKFGWVTTEAAMDRIGRASA